MLSVEEAELLFFDGFDLLLFSLLVVAEEVFTDFPSFATTVSEPVLVDTDALAVLFAVARCWDWVWVLGLTCTSQGGGALLYDGTILKVTDPRASRCNRKQNRLRIFQRRGELFDRSNLRFSMTGGLTRLVPMWPIG